MRVAAGGGLAIAWSAQVSAAMSKPKMRLYDRDTFKARPAKKMREQDEARKTARSSSVRQHER